MLKDLLNKSGVEKLSKQSQQSITGGSGLTRCPYVCRGTTARQPAGASQYCLLNFAAIIYNAPQCGGGGDDGIDIWA